jgi:hypothetical protein
MSTLAPTTTKKLKRASVRPKRGGTASRRGRSSEALRCMKIAAYQSTDAMHRKWFAMPKPATDAVVCSPSTDMATHARQTRLHIS